MYKTADAISAIGGVPVSDFARELSRSQAKGEITDEQMKAALFEYHKKMAEPLKTTPDTQPSS